MILAIIIVFFSIIALIVLHEFGHFIVAKKCGVKVEEFGIGLPPRLFKKKIRETVYSLNLLPLGGFVKIYGEEERIEDNQSFTGKPIWQRASIVLGGAVSFWLISAILLSIVFGIGAPSVISDKENKNLTNPQVQVVVVAPDSPAEKAGIRIGDVILKIKDQKSKIKNIDKVKQVQELVEKYKGQKITLTIERGKKIFDVTLVPRISPPKGEGPMGVGLVRVAEKSYPWYLAPIKGIEACLKMTRAIIVSLAQLLGDLVQGKRLPPGTQIMGPVGIGALMTHFLQLGFVYYLRFLALLSIYLAIFNLLPIPALDGGKLLFLGIEAVRKRPIPQKVEQNITGIFLAFLVALLIFITIKDIARLFKIGIF